MAIMKLLDLVLVLMVRSLLKNQKSWKAKICLNSEKRLNPKYCQNVEIHLNLILRESNKTNKSGYAVGKVLSQLVSRTKLDRVIIKTNLSQWYLIVFFSRKIILAEIQYKTQNSELLAIVKAFKIWNCNLEVYKHEVFILIDHNYLRHFMDTKSPSFRQICWAWELLQYHFQIDYCQGKVNTAADTLSRFSKKSQDKKDEFPAENGQILHCL